MKRILLALCALLTAAPLFAANVSTIAVAGSTVTVTTAASHGLAVNGAVCLSVTPACVVVNTVPNATSFTFTQPSNISVAVCSSACGTTTGAPRIIILDVQQPNQSQQTIHYLLWLTTVKPIPKSGAGSAWIAGAGSVGASPEQIAAMAAGNLIEQGFVYTCPVTLTTAQVQAYLQNDYTTRQAALVANTQPGQYYGSVWDGSGWGIQ